MTRHIPDTLMDVPNTYLGYEYIDKYYFITHKDTTTARLTASEVYSILKIFKNNTAVTLEDIENLAIGKEVIDNIYYTLEDAGVGIKTLRFNDYSKYAITLNKNVLYVMNTEIAYDLDLSFSEATIEGDLYDFYRERLGLDISITDIQAIFEYLYNHVYSAHVYNQATYKETNGIINYAYTNVIKTSNINDKSPVEYYATKNPNNENTYDTVIGNITSIDSINRTIQMLEPLPNTVKVGSPIQITNSPLNNGNYTVKEKYSIDEVSYLKVEESLSQDYIWPNLYRREIISGSYILNDLGYITSIDKENKSITLSGTPLTEVNVGDAILINGVPGFISETAYEVESISGNVITVTDSSQFTSDYTFTSASLKLGEPLSDILLSITKSSNETKLPKSDFMLDNNTQLTNYLELVNNDFNNKVPVPDEMVYNQIGNTIPEYIVIDGLSTTDSKIYFEGIYSYIYKD